MRIAIYHPDIPQNTGTMMRTAACLDVAVDIIEPCGFVFSDKHLRRAGMDYLNDLDVVRHASWQAFQENRGPGRLVLLSTAADLPYTEFKFQPGDTLLLGRESAGVPDDVHDAADARVIVPMASGARSLNVAVACAMVLGEALRQTR